MDQVKFVIYLDPYVIYPYKHGLQIIGGVRSLFLVVISPFEANAAFLIPLQISENQRLSDIFRGYEKGTLA